MRRDAQHLRKGLLFCWASLFIFGCSLYIMALVVTCTAQYISDAVPEIHEEPPATQSCQVSCKKTVLEILTVCTFCLKPTTVSDSDCKCFMFIDRQHGVFLIVINFWVNKKNCKGLPVNTNLMVRKFWLSVFISDESKPSWRKQGLELNNFWLGS